MRRRENSEGDGTSERKRNNEIHGKGGIRQYIRINYGGSVAAK